MDITSERAVHTYDIPDGVDANYQSVGLRELTTAEEQMCARKSKSDAVRLAYELAKMALCEVNGTALSRANSTLDKAWAGMPPKIRSLVLQAYGDLHAPSEEVAESFLRSRRTTQG